MGARVLPGVRLRDHVIVGANSVVLAGEYPSRCVIVGAPAKVVRVYDAISDNWVRPDEKGCSI